MFYALYLVGILYYFISGIGHGYANFIDRITGIYILVPCILILFCTRSFHAFGRSFLLAFGKKEDSVSRCEESLQSVRMVMLAAAISGVLCFFIGFINSCRSLSFEWSSADSMTLLLLDATVTVLSLFYSMSVCLFLLPIPFLLKKRLITLQTAAEDNRTLQEISNDGYSMKCVIVKELLSNYAHGLTSQETDENIRMHLESCDSCRMLYENLTAKDLNQHLQEEAGTSQM